MDPLPPLNVQCELAKKVRKTKRTVEVDVDVDADPSV